MRLFLAIPTSPPVTENSFRNRNYYGSPGAKYNDVAIATSVKPFNTWIDSIIQTRDETLTWNSASNGYFADYQKWTATRLSFVTPTAYDTVQLVETGGTPTITLWENTTTSKLRGSSGHTILDLGGYTYTLTYAGSEGALRIDNPSGSAQLTVRNGTVSLPSLKIATSAGGNGSFTIGTGAVVSCSQGTITVGERGTGLLTQNAGNLDVSGGTVYLGSQAGSHGTYWMQNGTLTNDYVVVGANGRGTFTHDAGTVNSGVVFVG